MRRWRDLVYALVALSFAVALVALWAWVSIFWASLAAGVFLVGESLISLGLRFKRAANSQAGAEQ